MALSWFALRLAWADALSHAIEQEPLERAVQLSPDNPEYRVRLASVLTAHGDDDRAVRLLKEAAALNPHDSRVWIALGLLCESSGDREHAEQYLIQATRVDRTFDPKWALANFYYRKADVDNFWQWARQSAETASDGYDLADYFRVCLTLTNNVKFILDDVLPDKITIQEPFLSYLLDEQRTMDAGTVAERLIPRAGAAQTPLLLRYCEALIAANRSDPAVAVWNALAAKNLIRERPLAPEADLFLTNGDFAVPILNSGFDWRSANAFGFNWQQPRNPPGFDLHFSGSQAEEIEPLLAQIVPLLPAQSYKLSFSYQTSGIDSGTGLSWRVSELSSTTPLAAGPVLVPSKYWTSSSFSFITSQATRLVRLELDYKRQRGTWRIEGSISLRHLALQQD